MDNVARRASVKGLLDDFRGIEPLRRLFWSELSYDREDAPLSRRGWPEAVSGALAEDPEIVASGAGGGFEVIHCRLDSGRLSLATERRVMEKLYSEGHDLALFVFSDRSRERWHFVNARFGGQDGRRRLYRRITVGPEEEHRTASERIAMLDLDAIASKKGKDPEDLFPLDISAEHDEAFAVEPVTNEFFRVYARVFARVEGLVEGIADSERRRLFTQRLFNRLMFLAFIQKKGWLKFGGNTNYLPALWEDYRRDEERDKNFYRDRLKLLFFSGLNTPNEVDVIGINEGGYLRELIGSVPYLNGGLFERGEDDNDDAVVVPDEAVRVILTDLFARFNFTVTESTPLDVEVAVDPEMLGRVFEELVTGRHETGSYYTPKPVVSFMCREALKGHLGARLPNDSAEAVRRFVEEHDPSGLRDPEGALEALRSVRVCDPACGSGAYLLGMLHELLDLRERLFAVRSLDPISNYDRKLEIIQKNLYGVDIDEFAVNIARLRLWLSLVVDFEGEEGRKPPPLPNLDFKIETGDSLTAPDPSGGLELDMVRDEQVSRLEGLKAAFLKAHGEDKKRLRREIEGLRAEISAWAHPGGAVSGFDWQVEFAEVFAGEDGNKGGFEVILANPPYLSTKHGFGKENRVWLKKLYRTAKGQYDAYGLFVERAISLMAKEGCYAYIVPKPILTNANMLPVRQVMQEHHLIAIADPGQVFDASVETVVIIGQRDKANGDTVRIYDESTFRLAASTPRTKTSQQLISPTGAWNIGASRNDSSIAGAQDLPTFGSFFDITRGVECGKRDDSILRQPADSAYPLLRGEDVARYAIQFSDYYIERGADDKKYKPIRMYTPPKLLVRRVTNNLAAAVDTVGYHVLNTLYVARPKRECPIALEYACALLNSQIANDYFREVYVNDDKVFPYVRKNQLESIPVAVPTEAQQRQVILLVRELSSLIAEEKLREEVEALIQQIDHLIAATYVD